MNNSAGKPTLVANEGAQKKYLLRVTYLYSLGSGVYGPLGYFDAQSLLHLLACRGEVGGISIEELTPANV
jgi:hypothetical protein